MKIDILTIFPEMLQGPFSHSILKRAQEKGIVEVRFHNFRDYATDRHHTVDDYAYGGGAGMVLRPEPVVAALGMIFRLAEGGLGPTLHLTGITVSQPNLVGATLFAIGSTFFCWLLLRGHVLPRALAWTGVVASVILVIGLPLHLGGLLGAPLTMLMWMPMLAFEVPGGLWLLAQGVPPNRSRQGL